MSASDRLAGLSSVGFAGMPPSAGPASPVRGDHPAVVGECTPRVFDGAEAISEAVMIVVEAFEVGADRDGATELQCPDWRCRPIEFTNGATLGELRSLAEVHIRDAHRTVIEGESEGKP